MRSALLNFLILNRSSNYYTEYRFPWVRQTIRDFLGIYENLAALYSSSSGKKTALNLLDTSFFITSLRHDSIQEVAKGNTTFQSYLEYFFIKNTFMQFSFFTPFFKARHFITTNSYIVTFSSLFSQFHFEKYLSRPFKTNRTSSLSSGR